VTLATIIAISNPATDSHQMALTTKVINSVRMITADVDHKREVEQSIAP
jgi:hypothetical protein